MTSNFELNENWSITFEGRHIDLHNNFDFIGYDYDISKRQMILNWTKSKGDWILENELNNLSVIHSNVNFLNIMYDNVQYEFPDDDKCLEFISFFPSADRSSNHGFISQVKPEETDDIIYSFETGHFIRIGCDNVVLIYK
jgi:hypothetical protein